LLKRGFLGWLGGERGHCSTVHGVFSGTLASFRNASSATFCLQPGIQPSPRLLAHPVRSAGSHGADFHLKPWSYFSDPLLGSLVRNIC
jgi:hypothetical protein